LCHEARCCYLESRRRRRSYNRNSNNNNNALVATATWPRSDFAITDVTSDAFCSCGSHDTSMLFSDLKSGTKFSSTH
jgi:hypothetical protein